MANEGKYIVGLDIGTTKVCTIVAERTDAGLNVVGVGLAQSQGMKKGMVYDIDQMTECIIRSVSEAEKMIDDKIQDVVIGIAGEHISGFSAEGMVSTPSGVITERDVKRVIDSAKVDNIPPDKKIIHIIPQEFIVDDQRHILKPVGMYGRKLKANIYIITGNLHAIKNIIRCCERAGLVVRNIVLQSIASAEAVLYPEEMEIGTVLVDIGGGTTDVAVFYNGSLVHTVEIDIAGNHITGDIAVRFGIPRNVAEEVKKKYGCASANRVSEKEIIQGVRKAGPGQLTNIVRKELAEVIQLRVEEIFDRVKSGLDSSPFPKYIRQVVLTGGTSQIPYIEEIAEKILGLPVRIGYPQTINGLHDLESPIFATGVGLVIYASKNAPIYETKPYTSGKGFFGRFREKVKQWFSFLFS
jgi:cell division protein FtsA